MSVNGREFGRCKERMVRENEQKMQGNGESHGKKVREKSGKGTEMGR